MENKMIRYRAKLMKSEGYAEGVEVEINRPIECGDFIHGQVKLYEPEYYIAGQQINEITLQGFDGKKWVNLFKINGKPFQVYQFGPMPEIKPANIDTLGEPKTFTIPANGLCSDEDLPDLNSCHQINKQFQSGKDRNDVEKAFDEWLELDGEHYSLKEWAKAFAVFFAERVKGGPL